MNPLTVEEKELILRVASLIEQGSEGMQQITGQYFRQDMSGCCALGACLKALGQKWPITDTSLLPLLGIQTWPRIEYPKSDLAPFAANEKLNTASIPDIIIFCNDRLGWPFERIVEYLRDATLDKPTIITVKGKKQAKL